MLGCRGGFRLMGPEGPIVYGGSVPSPPPGPMKKEKKKEEKFLKKKLILSGSVVCSYLVVK